MKATIIIFLTFITFINIYSYEIKNEKLIKWNDKVINEFSYKVAIDDTINNQLYICAQYLEKNSNYMGILLSKIDKESLSINFDTSTKYNPIPIEFKLIDQKVNLFWTSVQNNKINKYIYNDKIQLIDSLITTNENYTLNNPNNVIFDTDSLFYNYSFEAGIGFNYLIKTEFSNIDGFRKKIKIDSIESKNNRTSYFVGKCIKHTNNLEYLICLESNIDKNNSNYFIMIIKDKKEVLLKKSYKEFGNILADYFISKTKIINNELYILGSSMILSPRYFSICLMKLDTVGNVMIFKDSILTDANVSDIILKEEYFYLVGFKKYYSQNLTKHLLLKIDVNFDIKDRFEWKTEDVYNSLSYIDYKNDIFKLIGHVNGKIYFADLTELTNIIEENIDCNIFPNPASDYLEINVGANSRSPLQDDIEIYNIFGENTTQSNLSGLPPRLAKEGIIKIDISKLPAGVYFIKIGDKFEKFVKI